MASLEMLFYPTSGVFPRQYYGDAFAAEHGSWNRARRAGYEIIRIPMHDGHAYGSYEDFLTGFVTTDGQVWGRPVGVANWVVHRWLSERRKDLDSLRSYSIQGAPEARLLRSLWQIL